MFIEKKLPFTDKVLFIVHLAIGDFTYLQNCFTKLKNRYPDLRVDLFIQDVRITADSSKWEGLKNYILYEWLLETGLFHTIYYGYSPQIYEESIAKCQQENYPFVISLGDLRSQNYSLLARKIAQENLALGINIKTHLFSFSDKKALKALDFKIKDLNNKSAHISEKFAYWFEQFADISFSKEDLYPFINIPKKWETALPSLLSRHHWHQGQPIIFINIFAKDEDRCWSLTEAATLIQKLQLQSSYDQALFILNTLPENIAQITAYIEQNSLSSTIAFSAQNSFFELPALLMQCELIITVDTSIMHLATFSKARLISLLRKNRRQPSRRWLPLKKDKNHIIYTKKLGTSITTISHQDVLNILSESSSC